MNYTNLLALKQKRQRRCLLKYVLLEYSYWCYLLLNLKSKLLIHPAAASVMCPKTKNNGQCMVFDKAGLLRHGKNEIAHGQPTEKTFLDTLGI